MICTLLNRELGFVCRRVLRFLDRSLSTTMGCFFVCFRVRDDDERAHRPHAIRSSKPPEVVISRNRLSSLFLAEERDDLLHKEGSHDVSTPGNLGKELRNEAKFLKACGTLPETPAELRKALKLKDSPPPDRDQETPQFRSWLPNMPVRKSQLNKSQHPTTPVKLHEHLGNYPSSADNTPNSSISHVENTTSTCYNSAEGSGTESVNSATKNYAKDIDDFLTPAAPSLSAINSQYRSKSVRFDCDLDLHPLSGSSSRNVNQNQNPEKTPGNQTAVKPSPYPTPLKLSDDMQTPGTLFPANTANFPDGKARIRSEYVYSVPNTMENVPRWTSLKEGTFRYNQPSGEPRDTVERHTDGTTNNATVEEISADEDKIGASLSSWLKPPLGAASSRRSRIVNTPEDRPIIGLVATHWNEDEKPEVSPKWWDGNGIPNSTNKYKEDQKVCWHATPFEERLEKALSEDSFAPQRKNVSGASIAFGDNEDDDTALSKLKPSGHPQSVVSF